MSEDFGREYPTIAEIQKRLSVRATSTEHVTTHHMLHLATSCILIIFISFFIGLAVIPWVQTVPGKGKIIAYSANERQQTIEAPIDGRIAHWYVTEGERVKKDQALADMEDLDPQALERLRHQRDAAQLNVDAIQRSLMASRSNVNRQLSLFEKGLSSRRAYELSQIEVAKTEADVAKAMTELSKIENKLSRQTSQLVRASRDGTIMRIIAPQGGVVVKKGDILASLVPETKDRAVELFINGNDLPLVSVGREVRLQFEGWPAIQFAGWPSVAVGTFSGRVGVIDPSDDGKGNFRILVFPDNENDWPDVRYLRQGVRAVGWVLLDNVRLGWELWRQFNGFPPTSTPKEEAHVDTLYGPLYQSNKSK